MMKPYCINLDSKTHERVKKYAENHGIPRAVVIRLAVNEFFLKQGGKA